MAKTRQNNRVKSTSSTAYPVNSQLLFHAKEGKSVPIKAKRVTNNTKKQNNDTADKVITEFANQEVNNKCSTPNNVSDLLL